MPHLPPPLFTPEERSQLRSELLAHAARDARIGAGAVTGSAATGEEDRWSDIDLAFGVRGADAMAGVLADWTALLYERHGALHHHDVTAGAWIYRVFLLSNTLQVDLAFVEASEFRAHAPSFRLVFGREQEPRHWPTPAASEFAGWGWLYALHARSCIARNRLWQAEYMVSGVRDSALAMACVRHGASPVHGRGIDKLPGDVVDRFEGALVGRMEAAEMIRAFRVAVEGLLHEMRCADAGLAARLQGALTALAVVEGEENAMGIGE